MQIIGTQEALISALRDELSLTSSRLRKICIYLQNEVLCIDLEIELMYKKGENEILLKFIDVHEYSFFYSVNRIFYNVEIYKLFRNNDIFYVSFDPVDEAEIVSEDDQDYIHAKLIEGYLL